MRWIWVLMVVGAVAGCQAGEAEFARSPYGMRHAPVGDGKPVAVPGESGFYSYLPVVMAGGCTEAEYPLFSALGAAPVGENEAVLKSLGLIQKQKIERIPGSRVESDLTAASIDHVRLRLLQRFDFDAGAEGRSAWLFRPGFGGGSGDLAPRMLVLTDEHFRVIAFEPVMGDWRRQLPLVERDGQSLVLTFVHSHQAPGVVRVTGAAIEVSGGVESGIGGRGGQRQ